MRFGGAGGGPNHQIISFVEFFAAIAGKEKGGAVEISSTVGTCVGDFHYVKKSPQLKSRRATCHTILHRFGDKMC